MLKEDNGRQCFQFATAVPAAVAAIVAAVATVVDTARQTGAVKEIMAKVVSVQSSNKYAGQNSIFAMFCYESAELCDALMEQWFVDKLRLITTENAKKKYAKSCCMNMSPEDDNCLFILSNLMFNHFSNFVTQRKACRGKHQGKAMSLENALYEQSQSALKHLFRMSKYAMQPNFFNNLKQLSKVIRQHVTDKKVLEGNQSIIGKKKMGFDVFKKMCKLMMKEEAKEFIFSRACLTLEWNLMARSKNNVCAYYAHPLGCQLPCVLLCQKHR